MAQFDDRERAFEAKFAHDAEMQFRAQSIAGRKLGEWAAEILGKTGDDASAYVTDVIKSDLQEAGHEDIVEKLAQDLNGKLSIEDIRAKVGEVMAQTKSELLSASS